MKSCFKRLQSLFLIAVWSLLPLNMFAQSVRLSTDESVGRVYTQVMNSDLASAFSNFPICSMNRITDASTLNANGYGAIWKHNQIPFELSCWPYYISLETRKPLYGGYANILSATKLKDKGLLVNCDYTGLTRNASTDYYVLTATLPVGYRFTSYTLKLRALKKAELTTLGLTSNYEEKITITEGLANPSYDNGVLGYTIEGFIFGNDVTLTRKPQTMTRTSEYDDDMENTLYFIVSVDESVTDAVDFLIEDAVFEYECVPFTVSLSNDESSAVAGFTTAFDTGRLNLGDIYTQKNDNTSVVYYGFPSEGTFDDTTYPITYTKTPNYMKSAMMFYDGADVTASPTLGASTGTNRMLSRANGNSYLMAGTYYLETPVAANEAGDDPLGSGTGNSLPVGYRITGLTLTVNTKLSNGFYIRCKTVAASATDDYYYYFVPEYDDSGDFDEYAGNFYDNGFSNGTNDYTNYKTIWYQDSEGHIYTKYDGTIYYLENVYYYSGGSMAKGRKVAKRAAHTGSSYYWIKPRTEAMIENDPYNCDGGYISTYTIGSDNKIRTTLNEDANSTNYYINAPDEDDNGYIDGYLVDESTEHEAEYEAYIEPVEDESVSFAQDDTSYGGVKVQVFTNDSSTPLVEVSKDEGATGFEVTDGSAYITDETITDDVCKFTLGDAENAKDYINNDAIKIVVSDYSGNDITGKYYAEVGLDARLEPLNPYISKVIVDDENNLGETAVATAYGTQLYRDGFYNPLEMAVSENISTINLKFTALHNQNYLDLSNYADGNAAQTGYSLYGLVKSNKYNEGGENKSMYSSSDAVSDYISADNTMPQTAYTSYNNLEAIADAATSTYAETTYTEQLFSLSSYGDHFGTTTLAITDTDGKSYYVFTDDKPAFNISPTTLRHQSYAFYTGTINAVEATKYIPSLKFTKIYDTTFHDNAVDENAYYGVEVSADYPAGTVMTETDTSMALTVKQIEEHLENVIEEGGTDGEEYPYGVPADFEHIIYMDATSLAGIGRGTAATGYISDLRSKFADNAMLYIPSIEVTDTNVIKLVDEDYKATANIVLTDKQPMFIPYSFTKPDGAETGYSVEYVRNFTSSHDGHESLNTLILPFALTISDGTYENNLKFYTLKTSNCLTTTTTGEGTDYYDNAATFTLATGTETVANTPYLAVVSSSSTNDNEVFTIKETGAVEIVKTCDDEGNITMPMTGATSTGSVDSETVNFTSYGTYSGAALPKEDGYFYFGQSRLYKSNNLSSNYSYLYMYPFRVYYDFETSGTTTGSKLNSLAISLLDDSSATGIKTLDAADGRSVIVSTADGAIVVKALADTNVAVYSTSGQCVSKRNMAVGEVQTIPTAKGLYVVNGQKVIVK